METLPDEVILKVLRNLNLNELLAVTKVSQTFARLSLDPSLWRTVSLTEKEPFLHKRNGRDSRPGRIAENILGTVSTL